MHPDLEVGRAQLSRARAELELDRACQNIKICNRALSSPIIYDTFLDFLDFKCDFGQKKLDRAF